MTHARRSFTTRYIFVEGILVCAFRGIGGRLHELAVRIVFMHTPSDQQNITNQIAVFIVVDELPVRLTDNRARLPVCVVVLRVAKQIKLKFFNRDW